MGRHGGIYQGIVRDNRDPEKKLRLKVEVFEVPGVADWALPCLTAGQTAIPGIGQTVWLLFQAGEANRPVWLGILPRAEDG